MKQKTAGIKADINDSDDDGAMQLSKPAKEYPGTNRYREVVENRSG